VPWSTQNFFLNTKRKRIPFALFSALEHGIKQVMKTEQFVGNGLQVTF